MIKKIISLLLMAITFASPAMEKPTPEPSHLAKIADELKLHIIKQFADAKSLDEAISAFRNLKQVNKEFYNVVNDPALTKWIIEELSQKKYIQDVLNSITNAIPNIPFYTPKLPQLGQNSRLILVSAALNTTASIEWLRNYLKDPKNMESAEYLFVQMAGKNVNLIDGLLKAGVNPNARSK